MKNRIRQLREQIGLKQKELATILNIDKSQISRYENGKLDVSTQTLEKMAELFNCSVNYILCIDAVNGGNSYDELMEYKRVARIAKDSGITPQDLEEQVLILRKMLRKEN